jgi:hypothetical protein
VEKSALMQVNLQPSSDCPSVPTIVPPHPTPPTCALPHFCMVIFVSSLAFHCSRWLWLWHRLQGQPMTHWITEALLNNFHSRSCGQIEIDHAKKLADLEKLRSSSDNKNRMSGGSSSMMGDEADFTPAPRRTADDEANVRTSLNRALDDKLYLIAKGSSGTWRMPELTHSGEPSLRETAQKCLDSVLGPSTEVHFVGNFPVLCETRAADGKGVGGAAAGASGVKTFYYRAALVSMTADVTLDESKHAWVTKSEMEEYNAGFAALAHRFMP